VPAGGGAGEPGLVEGGRHVGADSTPVHAAPAPTEGSYFPPMVISRSEIPTLPALSVAVTRTVKDPFLA
jgi:hypothetical protein